jgi:isopenicillin N synthase-like dioxygenase
VEINTGLQQRTRSLDRSDLAAATIDFDSIPLIDIRGLFSPSPADHQRVADAIGTACRDVGFFYVTGHGIPQRTIDDVYRMAEAFFDLPLEQKLRYDSKRLRRHRGYVAMGDLAADPHDQTAFDLQEGYEVSLELPESDPDHRAGHIMYGPNVWPEAPAGFRPVVYQYFEAVLALGRTLFHGFALALDLEEDHFDTLIDKPMAQLRVLQYPRQPEPIDPRHIGVSAHTDYECFTILATSAPGLQVQNRAGQWIEAPPIPGAFVINIGDCMERWTNDIFVSTVHRVINRTAAKRFSLPFFFGANHGTVVSCLPTCSGPDRPPRYAPTTAGEWTVSNITAAYAYRKGSSTN